MHTLQFRPTLLAAALALALPAQAAPATVEWVPLASGAYDSFAMGIGPAGHLVGLDRLTSGSNRAWMLTPNGQRYDLGLGASSVAVAVNASGAVAGFSDMAGNGTKQGWRWTSTHGYKMLETETDGVYGIDAAGNVVGAQGHQAWRWGANQSSEALNNAGWGSIATGINDSGTIVGVIADGTRQPVRWQHKNATPTRLPTPGARGWVSAINNPGDAVGYVPIDAGNAPVAWSATNQLTLLDRAAWDVGDAAAINDSGQIVGQLDFSDGSGPTSAVLWTSRTAAPFRLDSLLGDNVTHSFAMGISRHAQVALNVTLQGREQAAARLTLHPTWTGGSGVWNDGAWDWSGAGPLPGVQPGVMHDVRIAPTQAATVYGADDGWAGRLSVTGANFDLAGGKTQVLGAVTLEAGGTLMGAGRLSSDGDVSFLSGSALALKAGQTMRIQAQALRFEGQGRLEGDASAPARLEVAATPHIAPKAQLDLLHAEASFDQTLLNEGELTLAHGRLLLSGQGLLQRGGLTVAEGEVRFHGRVALEAGSRNHIAEGGMATFVDLLVLGADLTGRGEARVDSLLFVGIGPQAVNVTPHLDMGAAAVLVMDVGDHLTLDGQVTLRGNHLALSWWDHKVGKAGDVLDLFDWNGQVKGGFGYLSLPALDAGLAWDTSDLYAGGTLSITAVPEPATLLLWLGGLAGVIRARRR